MRRMEEPLRLVVLANDPLARAGIAALLSSLPGCTVVAQGSTDLLFDSTAGDADILVDLFVWDMGWGSNEAYDGDLSDIGTPLLALVADEETAAHAWRLGARGILSREMNEERLAAAIAAVVSGLIVFAPSLSAALSRDESDTNEVTSDLTPRELEVLTALAEGLTNKAIAQHLAISDHTVKFHVNSILNKLDAQSRTDAVVRAARLGLIAL